MEDSIERVYSAAPWEPTIGYCRAIRMGNIVAVTGTTSLTNDGQLFAEGDPYRQSQRCLELIESALAKLGLDRRSIIRTRMFVTDISHWAEYGKAHGEFFRDCPPATSMLEIKSLIDPRMLIEIEADAIVAKY